MLNRILILGGLCSFLLFSCVPNEEFEEETEGMELSGVNAEENSSLNDDVIAYKSVLKLVKETGLDQNFLIIPEDISTAAAYLEEQDRFLAYNKDYIKKIYGEDGFSRDWVAVGKVAHEIGHHLSEHKLVNGVASPEEILEADKYSGFVFYKLGASADTAMEAMKEVVALTTTEDMPPLEARLNAMNMGYNDAKTLEEKIDTILEESLIAIATDDQVVTDSVIETSASEEVASVETKPTEEGDSGSEEAGSNGVSEETAAIKGFSYKCVFLEDSSVFYIDQNNQISSYVKEKFMVVGYKTPSNKPGFEWVFSANDMKYGVDQRGRIWSRSLSGQFEVIGHAYRLKKL